MSSDREAPIIVGPFAGSAEARIAECETCRHARYVVDDESRTVECGACGKTLDAFDILMEYAARERIWQTWDTKSLEAAKRVKALEDEESKARARVRALNGKDAKFAVEKERSNYEQMLGHAAYKAKKIEELAAQIGRAVHGELGKRRQSRPTPNGGASRQQQHREVR